MTFTRATTHQKHLAQSGRSTRSAVDISNTLRVFTKEPIRKHEIKLECMNIAHIIGIYTKTFFEIKYLTNEPLSCILRKIATK